MLKDGVESGVEMKKEDWDRVTAPLEVHSYSQHIRQTAATVHNPSHRPPLVDLVLLILQLIGPLSNQNFSQQLVVPPHRRAINYHTAINQIEN